MIVGSGFLYVFIAAVLLDICTGGVTVGVPGWTGIIVATGLGWSVVLAASDTYVRLARF